MTICDNCERSRLEAESKCRGLHRWLSSNCHHQVFIIVYWTSNTAFSRHIVWLNWFIDVKQPVFGTFYCVSTSFFFLSSHPHPLLKVTKTLSNLSGSRSRLYIRCNTTSGYFFLLNFGFLVLFATTVYSQFTMLGHQFAFSAAPIRKVKEVQFGILSPEEIVRVL